MPQFSRDQRRRASGPGSHTGIGSSPGPQASLRVKRQCLPAFLAQFERSEEPACMDEHGFGSTFSSTPVAQNPVASV